MDKPVWGKYTKYHDVQLQVKKIPYSLQQRKSIQQCKRYVLWPMGKPIWVKWANDHNATQLQVWTIPQNFKQRESIQQFQRYALKPMGMPIDDIPIWMKWANAHDIARLQV